MLQSPVPEKLYLVYLIINIMWMRPQNRLLLRGTGPHKSSPVCNLYHRTLETYFNGPLRWQSVFLFTLDFIFAFCRWYTPARPIMQNPQPTLCRSAKQLGWEWNLRPWIWAGKKGDISVEISCCQRKEFRGIWDLFLSTFRMERAYFTAATLT